MAYESSLFQKYWDSLNSDEQLYREPAQHFYRGWSMGREQLREELGLDKCRD